MSLDGVVVCETEISEVDGERGRLLVRGYPLEQLAGRVSFAEMLRLLWRWESSTEQIEMQLAQARCEVFPEIAESVGSTLHLEPIEALRSCLDRLHQPSPLRITAALPVALACWAQLRQGRPVCEPDPHSNHVRDFLRMRCTSENAALSRALETYLVCVAEHGMNASTFTARVVASTRADARASISAALGALQGPLHGGAPGPVLDMLDELEHHPDRGAWMRAKVLQGERLMGFGHRIYKVRDPRADVLSQACSQLPQASARFARARQVEELARTTLQELKPGRRLDTNVEYYTALLLDGVGFERSEFTAVFACGRVLGWLAHVEEQQQSGRLIRPDSRYVGPSYETTARSGRGS